MNSITQQSSKKRSSAKLTPNQESLNKDAFVYHSLKGKERKKANFN